MNRERERERERETETERQRDRQTDRQTDRARDRDRCYLRAMGLKKEVFLFEKRKVFKEDFKRTDQGRMTDGKEGS